MYAADGKVGEHVYVYLHLSLAKTYKGDFESSPNSSETKYISINQNNTPFFELEKKDIMPSGVKITGLPQ